MKDKYNIDYDSDFQQTASANDCTGLIPANNLDGEYDEVYKELYNYEPPFVTLNKAEK